MKRTIKHLKSRIKALDKALENTMLNNKNKGKEMKDNQKPNKQKELTYQPPRNMDMDGNSIVQETVWAEEHTTPLDFVELHNKKFFRNRRKNMSESLNTKVNDEMNKFIKDKKDDPNLETKHKTDMTPDERDIEIQRMLTNLSLYVGVAPISREHYLRVQQKLVKRGVIPQSTSSAEKQQITTKSLVKSWAKKYLAMEDSDWENIAIRYYHY